MPAPASLNLPWPPAVTKVGRGHGLFLGHIRMHVSIRLLGGFEVAVDGLAVPSDAWPRRSASALVKLLALQPGHRLRRELVLDALWPGLLAERAAPRLHTAAHYARAALAWTAMTFLGEEAGYRDALRLSDRAIGLARVVGEAPLVAQALNVKGELARMHGDGALARAAYEEGRELAARVGDDAQLSVFLAHLGHLAVAAGAFDEGRRLEQRALALAWAAGRRMLAAWFVSDLAGPELGLGRPERAAVLVGAADAALRSLGAVRAPGVRPHHEAVVRGLRQTLGEPTFRRLHDEGTGEALADAVRLGLSAGEEHDARDDDAVA